LRFALCDELAERVGASARPQPVHEGWPLREQQHDHEDQEQVAQKAGDA
jgi:hypothetical protein